MTQTWSPVLGAYKANQSTIEERNTMNLEVAMTLEVKLFHKDF